MYGRLAARRRPPRGEPVPPRGRRRTSRAALRGTERLANLADCETRPPAEVVDSCRTVAREVANRRSTAAFSRERAGEGPTHSSTKAKVATLARRRPLQIDPSNSACIGKCPNPTPSVTTPALAATSANSLRVRWRPPCSAAIASMLRASMLSSHSGSTLVVHAQPAASQTIPAERASSRSKR